MQTHVTVTYFACSHYALERYTTLTSTLNCGLSLVVLRNLGFFCTRVGLLIYGIFDYYVLSVYCVSWSDMPLQVSILLFGLNTYDK